MDFASFKEQVRSAADIVEVIAEYGVALKRVGVRYTGRCPFHNEKTPSFSVNQNMQRYKCFGCGVSGDVFKFVEEKSGMTFVEAVKYLAERYGVPIPKRVEVHDPETARREAIYRMNEIALRLFRGNLLGAQGAEARAYLGSRGVMGELAEEFSIGLADRGGQALTAMLQREGFTAEQLEHSGLVLKRQEGGGFFDRFRGRLIFTIHNEQGKIAGFAGRAMTTGEEPKYLNSPETPVYRKSQILYNLHRARDPARKGGRTILVEGYMDVIGLWAGGIHEVVASCGTALTSGQVKLMKRLSETVVVNFDPDTAGANAAERSLEVLLEESMRVRILELDQELDPDEYIRKAGQEQYRKLLERAPNYYYWLAGRAKQRFDSNSAEGRSQAMRFLLPQLNRIPDKIERAGVAADLASYLGVERGVVLDAFKKAALDRREALTVTVAPPLKPAERIVLKALLNHPELREEIVPGLERAPLAQLRSGTLLRAIVELWPKMNAFRYEDLEARLEQSERSLLSDVAFADEIHETAAVENARVNALASLETLVSGDRSSRIAHMRLLIQQAQQKGDMPEALRLLQELERLQKGGTIPQGMAGGGGSRQL